MSQRKPGYGAKIKDTLTGAQKRKPAESFRNFRANFDRAFSDDENDPVTGLDDGVQDAEERSA